MAHDAAAAMWNERFSGDGYRFGTEPNAFLAAQRHRLKPGMRALSIADGEGRNGVWLAKQGLDVSTVDFSPVAVEKAKRLAVANNVTIRAECADLTEWDWGQPRFDLVVGIFFQAMGPAGRAIVFRRMKEALVPGGLLMIEGYRPEQLAYKTGGPALVENLYTEEILRQVFGDMEILLLAAYDAELNEGDSHAGMSAVIDLVARK